MIPEKYLLDFIISKGGATREHLILQHIVKEQPAFFSVLGNRPSLYKKHFYLFHILYKIRNLLLKENRTIIISALEIRLCRSSSTEQNLAEPDGLSEFYLNENNLNLSDEEVNEMLSLFWKKYLAVEQKTHAIEVLGLQGIEPLNTNIIKKQFNKLALKHHPDRGGDEGYFIELRQAYETLNQTVC